MSMTEASFVLDRSVGITELEEQARRVLDPAVYDYCAGGAGDEQTLVENVAAFRHFRMAPRAFVDVDSLDTGATVLGHKITAPILVAPVSLQGMVDQEGEVASARAAAGFGTVFGLSMNATRSPEDVAAATPSGCNWAQIYVLRDWSVTESVMRRCEGAGFRAFIVTVDVPRVGRRERDIRNNFSRLQTGDPDIQRDPAFGALLDQHLNIEAAYDAVFPNPAATWTDLERVRALTELPIVVKGILRAADARRAVDMGAAAIVVSNHGGRQFERAAATIDVLAEIVAAVDDEAEVYLDSGVRRGTDVLTALAVGADAVLIGRAMLWGLAAAGEAGVTHALEILREQLAAGMTAVGAATIADIDASLLVETR